MKLIKKMQWGGYSPYISYENLPDSKTMLSQAVKGLSVPVGMATGSPLAGLFTLIGGEVINPKFRKISDRMDQLDFNEDAFNAWLSSERVGKRSFKENWKTMWKNDWNQDFLDYLDLLEKDPQFREQQKNYKKKK